MDGETRGQRHKHARREAGRHFVIFAGSKRGGGVWNVVAKTSLSASWNNRSGEGTGGGGGFDFQNNFIYTSALNATSDTQASDVSSETK